MSAGAEFGPDPVLLDRLVDGELGDAERRELLDALDHEPQGWRRCALAFLEAQAWRQACQNVTAPAAAPPAEVALAPEILSKPRHWESRAIFSVAAAAALFLAFGLGAWTWRELAAPDASLPPIARGATDGVTREVLVADEDEGRTAPFEGMDEPRAPTVQLLVADRASGQTSRVELPLIEAQSVAEAFSSAEYAMPLGMLEALREAGHEVERERHYWPIRLQDGRTAIVPVEEVQVRRVRGAAL